MVKFKYKKDTFNLDTFLDYMRSHLEPVSKDSLSTKRTLINALDDFYQTNPIQNDHNVLRYEQGWLYLGNAFYFGDIVQNVLRDNSLENEMVNSLESDRGCFEFNKHPFTTVESESNVDIKNSFEKFSSRISENVNLYLAIKGPIGMRVEKQHFAGTNVLLFYIKKYQ